MSSIEATIHSDGYVTVNTNQGRKNISIADYLTGLREFQSRYLGEVEESDTITDSFVMPNGIHRADRTNFGHRVTLYYPEATHTVSHDNGDNYTIPFPNVVIEVDLHTNDSGFRFGRIKWYATTRGRLSLPAHMETDHDIWYLPMPNMFDSGEMCLGSNSLPGVVYNDWSILDMLYNDILVRSKFNNDLSVRETRRDYSGSGWLTELDGHDSFPYDLLR